jgi:hypothetical protein
MNTKNSLLILPTCSMRLSVWTILVILWMRDEHTSQCRAVEEEHWSAVNPMTMNHNIVFSARWTNFVSKTMRRREKMIYHTKKLTHLHFSLSAALLLPLYSTHSRTFKGQTMQYLANSSSLHPENSRIHRPWTSSMCINYFHYVIEQGKNAYHMMKKVL